MRLLISAFIILISVQLSESQTPNLHWKYEYDGVSHFEDRGNCNTYDHSDNLIVAGHTDNGCTANDIIVIKYDTAGDTLWSRLYNGSGTYGQNDYPNAIVTDTSGNIYIAGITESNSFFYAVTLKYSPSGTLLWEQKYLTAESAAYDVEVDVNGNVYTCGYREISNNKDFLVIKYNSSGAQQWMQNYSSGNHDEAVSLVVDASGNCYVTGKASGVNFFFDWATVKYDPSGNQVWADTFGSATATWSEEPAKIVIDASGYLYVTGTASLGSISNKDYYIIKYDQTGNRIWENSYAGTLTNGADTPVDIAVDPYGNVFITGNSVGNPTGQDIVTVKFNPSGQFVWENRIDSIQQTDYARSIVFDNQTNSVILAGDITVSTAAPLLRDWVVVRLDTSGTEIMNSLIDGPGNTFDIPFSIALNSNGNFAVTGFFSMNTAGLSNNDIGTVFYDGMFNIDYTKYFNGDAFADDQGADMVVDAAGNTYVCGFTYNNDIYYEDLVVFKLNASGQRLWTYVYRGNEETSSEKAVAIAVDSQQNVYVTGTTDSTAGSSFRNIITVRLDANGLAIWENTFTGTGSGSDYPVDIEVAPNGNIIVAANTLNSGTGIDATMICYDPSGTLLWSAPFDNGGQGELFQALAIDNNNNAYGAGTYLPANGFLSDGLLVKFDPSGTVLWDTTYDFSASNSDRDFFNSIALDNADNVFVAGQANNNFVTAKYLPNGNPEWIQNYSHSSFPDSATAIAIDPFGDVLVGGTFGQPVEADYGLVKYRNNGTLVWDRMVANTAGSDDILTDLVVDAAGSTYLTGWETLNFTTNYNFMTIKYDSAGVLKYGLIWTDPAGVAPDYGKRIGLDANGNIYVMGDANENCFGNTFINGYRWNTQVIRYGQGVFSGTGNENADQQDQLQIFPNPASGNITIKLPGSVFRNKEVNLKFYDLKGKLLLTLKTDAQTLVEADIRHLPSGMIICEARNEFGQLFIRVMKF
jgi:uncharacterized delta-60 repeat protein